MLSCQLSLQMTTREIRDTLYQALTAAELADCAQVFALAADRAHDEQDTVQAALRAAPELWIDWTEVGE